MSKRKRKSEAPTARPEKAVASGLPRSTAIVAPSAEQPLARWEWWFLAGVTLFALALRAWRLGMPSLFLDEIDSVLRSMRPLKEILTPGSSQAENFPPLHYVLIHWAIAIFGRGDWAVRIPAVVAGAATAGLQFLLGRNLFGRRAGVISSLLVALSVYHIQYSRDAHAYAVYGCLAAVSLYFFSMRFFASRGGWVPWVGYASATAGMLLTHYFGVIAVAQEAAAAGVASCWQLLGGQKRRALKGMGWLAGALACVVVVSAPYMAHFLSVSSGSTGTGTAILKMDMAYLRHFLAFQGFGNGAGAALFAGLLVAGVVRAAIRRRGLTAFLLFWLVFPYALFATVHTQIFFHVRRLIFTFPVLMLFCAEGVEALLDALPHARRRCLLGGALCAVWAALTLPTYRDFYAMTGHDVPRREIAEWMTGNLPEGAIVLYQNYYELRWVGPGYYHVPGRTFAFVGIFDRPGDGERYRVEDRYMAFLEKYPEAAFMFTGGGDEQFRSRLRGHFGQQKVFLNAGGLGLSGRGLFHHFIEGSAGRQDIWRVRWDLFYNTDEDLVARARRGGVAVFRKMGKGFEFVLTRDLRDWMAVGGEATVVLHQLGQGPRDVMLKGRFVGIGADGVEVRGPSGELLDVWRCAPNLMGDCASRIAALPSGATEIHLRVRPAPGPGGERPVALFENITVAAD